MGKRATLSKIELTNFFFGIAIFTFIRIVDIFFEKKMEENCNKIAKEQKNETHQANKKFRPRNN